jgi:hypothetical protein
VPAADSQARKVADVAPNVSNFALAEVAPQELKLDGVRVYVSADPTYRN